ncbi:MAG: VCBS repeat-containing protein, partial [Vicinamibacteria bacterium]
VVDLDRDGRLDLLVADLGAPAPSDDTKGSVQWLRAKADRTYEAIPLATALPRTADAQPGDFDGDGDLDVVVAAFGWRKAGGILLLENRTTDWAKPAFVARTLDERTGAIHVPVTDLDGDGKLDFVALLSQHHETVVAFLGDGKGGFRRQTIDAAPHPAWGSSGIQLVDLDGDRDQDVLVTNGDMLDDYQLKPYHGIRWLENKGGFPFVAHDVAAMPGVIRAQAADLDGDGDLDIVAGSLVQTSTPSGPAKSPDAPSLVWLEQTASGVFARHTLERGAQHLSLDLGDLDGDGRVDIVTANSLSGGSGVVEVWRNRGAAR